ncbi:Protease synthase and sporulation negative regulatory protein PAI 1 [Burkholderia sp. AD24]|uniref:GNAT family N-acetyltransferase n=1 Tax=Paraburkholderia bryophila TaxID=420952 RepID=UPI000B5FAD2D|nr:GNAT family N-acetyltransferase [Paraburkholderia bryophila]ASL43188.1 Protease synthase and sporulation negative regulatory protein PAI 1 [Burkholderia sp. AD24]WCM20701.1 GNAT family N-acetyltransferase [Paraburkholderia bryophila]
MSPSLTVRRIAADQGAVFRELRTASLREAPYAFGATLEDALSADAASFDATAVDRAVSLTVATFILYTEGHPAGLIEAHFDDSAARRAFVCELWVAPAVRHLRGGELLVDTAGSWLANEGAMEVYAWVADANRNAMRFYEALGFGPTGEHRRVQRAPEQAESLLVRHVPTTSQVFQQ